MDGSATHGPGGFRGRGIDDDLACCTRVGEGVLTDAFAEPDAGLTDPPLPAE
jgi:hypothetical protein